mmetsp:Transcript_10022/g.21066  ORF Transcript_10022/g.21066 Transcript_10022/m.21066 type:complete len:414 (-) Transcript_10022:1104-2345(-)
MSRASWRSVTSACSAPPCPSTPVAQVPSAPLHKRIVRATEHGLRLLQRIGLPCPRLLTHIVVLDQPIALGVEGLNVLERARQLLPCGRLRLVVRLEVRLQGGLSGTLLSERLRVSGALLRGILHHLLIVLLRLLLRCLGLSHLLVKVLHQQVDHGDHACALCGLRRIGPKGLRRWWRGDLVPLVMHRDLCEDGDARARDAAGRRRRRRGAAEVDSNAVLPRELPLGRGLVELWIVKLVQPVLGNREKLLGCGVRGHELRKLLVLRLPLRRGLGHRLVQGRNALLQGGDIFFRGTQSLLRIRNHCVEVRDGALEPLLLIVGGVELIPAVLLLVIIVLLLLLQGHDHAVDHLEDLLEAHLLALDGQDDEVEIRAAGGIALARLLEGREGSDPTLLQGTRTDLHEAGAGAGESFLE